jgi:hypothetical protein
VRRNGLISAPRPSRIFATQSGSPIKLRPIEMRSKSPRSKRRTRSPIRLVPVGRASSPVSVAMTSMSRPTLPTAITGASVNDLTQPASPRSDSRSDPGHSGVQNRRVETWNRSVPAARRIETSSPSSAGLAAILAS